RMVNVSCPVLFIHGASDSLIPVEHSKTLFSLCRSRKLLVTPAKMDHNSSMFSDPNAFAVPAIHFFGFPGWRTLTPPFMPFDLFE
ncbi:abhd13, partial [Symbiodinium sp. KB8]